ncbi:Excinuclease ABC subunit C [Syntrophus gentianae]|uniref:UvrABC system protein C n=1 Tax=Syntrophus gentianae TaxID=43775 RepID=A0A1H7YZF3_9BACT|nr:excinuclease ABC subunit UvrC [Syntrophus gentianae]SEM51682.1 Excinuclease ABC subunit C [Syntrophus gentianae]
MKKELESRISSAPRTPGVYLMKDASGKVLYVGKAKDLKSRIRAYFGGTDSRAMIPFLVSRISDLEFIVTETEKEALILENNLIKEHRPRYNVYFRDDKAYFNVRVDLNEPFPRFQMVRRPRKDRAKYFGPYPSSASARETLQFLQSLFPLRTCRDAELNGRTRPCLEYQIRRCLAPCVGRIDSEDYLRMVRDGIVFLEGREKKLLGELKKRMTQAAEEMNFEEAAQLRDRIGAIERTLEKQRMVSRTTKDQDIFGLYREGPLIQVCVLLIRSGKILGSQPLPVLKYEGETKDMLSSLLVQYYDSAAEIPQEILIPYSLEDQEIMNEYLEERRGKALSLLVPRRGRGLELLRIAQQNAEHRLKMERKSFEDPEASLPLLMEKLHLRRFPEKIEAFDISNIGGRLAVASMVTFCGGRPWKSGYRRFRIRTVEGADDYAMMYEALKRRYSTGENMPDLIVVDGGKGQLAVALSLLKDLSISGPDVIGLAKERADSVVSGGGVNKSEDRVYLPHKKEALYLSRWPSVLFLLQRIRDEAHRFAVSYHRHLKTKSDFLSQLDNIPGIGAVRKKTLLRYFGDIQKIREAPLEELAAVKGIGKEMGEKIFAFFHEGKDEAPK